MNRSVLVLGGGVSGLTLSLELRKFGLDVCLLEKGSRLGGRVSEYCCKATESCNRCFVCVGDKLVERFLSSGIEYYTDATLLYISRSDEAITVEFEGRGPDLRKIRDSRRFRSCALCVGFTPFEAENFKKEYGYGLWKGVITSLDLEKVLRDEGDLGGDVKRIAFIQCVGSRDRVSGNFYCSRVCCGYSLRMADLLMENDPEREIYFFYMDIQPLWKGFESFLERVLSKGIKVVRAIPSKIYGFRDRKGVSFVVPGNGVSPMEFDMAVLSIGMTPSRDLDKLSLPLSLERDGFGFVKASPSNVFPVGTTVGPMDIMGSIRSARKVSLDIAGFMGVL